MTDSIPFRRAAYFSFFLTYVLYLDKHSLNKYGKNNPQFLFDRPFCQYMYDYIKKVIKWTIPQRKCRMKIFKCNTQYMYTVNRTQIKVDDF